MFKMGLQLTHTDLVQSPDGSRRSPSSLPLMEARTEGVWKWLSIVI